jgi:nucleotide-binding universal stress UspA family protein
MNNMILLCYDGSEDARTAITQAGKLFPGQPATVLTVWEPFIEVIAHASLGLGMAGGIEDIESIDAATRDSARRQAEAGAELARDAGLEAHRAICAQTGTVAAAILRNADELDVTAIVAGSRGLTGVRSWMLGSVSHALIQHADRAVVIVPSDGVAAARRSHADQTRSVVTA